MKKTINYILVITLIIILYFLCAEPFGEGTATQICVNFASLLGVCVWASVFAVNNPEFSDWLRR